MDVVIPAVAVLVGALVTALVGPAWKSRHDRRRAAEEIVSRYSRPLLQAAFELQSRLYNIVRLAFLTSWVGGKREHRVYAEESTLWLVGQYLGWTEILRREVQLLDLGDVARTQQLRDRLLEVAELLATDRLSDSRFQLNRSDQRAIGELMIVRRRNDTGTRSDCLGYAEFRVALRDAEFAAWFKGLRNSIVATIGDGILAARLSFVQRALIDLIDLLDPDRSAFPDPDIRGKLPLPYVLPGKGQRTRLRLARFIDDVGWQPFEEWAAAQGLEANGNAWKRSVASSSRVGARFVLVAERDQDGRWLTLDGWAEPPRWARSLRVTPETMPLTRGGRWFATSRKRGRLLANDLLERYDRPLVL